MLVAAAFAFVGGGCRNTGTVRASPPAPAPVEDQPADSTRDAATPPDPETWYTQASPCVYEEWRARRSGYALLEILEREIIDDRWDGYRVKPGITSARVRELLGEPTCKGSESREDCYPNYGPGDWLYNGGRLGQPQDYWHFHFDSEGVLRSLDWSGE